MRFSCVFLFLIGLYGCVSVPDHDLAQVSGPISLEGVQQAALAQEDFEIGCWPHANWWEMFGDSQLNELIELALSQSPTLQLAEAKVEFFRQMAFKIRSSLFPKLDLNYIEDKDAEVDANVVMTGRGQFVEVQSSGEESTFSHTQLQQLLGLAQKGLGELAAAQSAFLAQQLL